MYGCKVGLIGNNIHSDVVREFECTIVFHSSELCRFV